MLDPKFGYVGQRADQRTVEEARHFYLCPACGQPVDKRDLAAVFHHEEKGHSPLPAEESTRLTQITAMLTAALMDRNGG